RAPALEPPGCHRRHPLRDGAEPHREPRRRRTGASGGGVRRRAAQRTEDGGARPGERSGALSSRMVSGRRAIVAWVSAGAACHRAGATARQPAAAQAASTHAAAAHPAPSPSLPEARSIRDSGTTEAAAASLRLPFGAPTEVTRYTCPSLLAG